LDFGLSNLEHTLAEIYPYDIGSTAGESECQVAGTAANVEGAQARNGRSQANQAPLPITMQAEALKIVHEIVARSDFAEEFVHLRCALLAGIVILIQSPKFTVQSPKSMVRGHVVRGHVVRGLQSMVSWPVVL